MSRRRVANPTPSIITRLDAANSGKTRFYTGLPCKHGHIVERFVSGGACVQCVNPIIRVCGAEEEFYNISIPVKSALTGEQRNELTRLVRAWADAQLTAWGMK